MEDQIKLLLETIGFSVSAYFLAKNFYNFKREHKKIRGTLQRLDYMEKSLIIDRNRQARQVLQHYYLEKQRVLGQNEVNGSIQTGSLQNSSNFENFQQQYDRYWVQLDGKAVVQQGDQVQMGSNDQGKKILMQRTILKTNYFKRNFAEFNNFQPFELQLDNQDIKGQSILVQPSFKTFLSNEKLQVKFSQDQEKAKTNFMQKVMNLGLGFYEFFTQKMFGFLGKSAIWFLKCISIFGVYSTLDKFDEIVYDGERVRIFGILAFNPHLNQFEVEKVYSVSTSLDNSAYYMDQYYKLRVFEMKQAFRIFFIFAFALFATICGRKLYFRLKRVMYETYLKVQAKYYNLRQRQEVQQLLLNDPAEANFDQLNPQDNNIPEYSVEKLDKVVIDGFLCVDCNQNERNLIYLPCKHLLKCDQCFMKDGNSKRICGQCEGFIQKIMKIYID